MTATLSQDLHILSNDMCLISCQLHFVVHEGNFERLQKSNGS